MSFSSNVKGELCRIPLHKTCCAIAEAYGILLFCNTFSPGRIRIVTENREFALRLPKLFRKAFDLEFDQLPDTDAGKMTFAVEEPEKLRRIFAAFGLDADKTVTLHVNLGVLEEECCRTAFLRGAFLAGGSVTDPEKRYHLELATSHLKASREVYSLMLEQQFLIKDTLRGGNAVLYFKQSDYIEDFLTTIGAPVCAMHIMEAKVEKDMSNAVNRQVNCDTANAAKIVDASQAQLAAIRKLEENGAFHHLPDKIKKTALLRKEFPEAPLSELAQMHEPPLSKSAINHRMRKLLELAREL